MQTPHHHHPLDQDKPWSYPTAYPYQKRYGFRQRLHEARLVLFTYWSLHLAWQLGRDGGIRDERQRVKNGGR